MSRRPSTTFEHLKECPWVDALTTFSSTATTLANAADDAVKGTIIGLAIALNTVAAGAVSILDMALWGAIACISQLVVYLIYLEQPVARFYHARAFCLQGPGG